jgi:hypothetical protein
LLKVVSMRPLVPAVEHLISAFTTNSTQHRKNLAEAAAHAVRLSRRVASSGNRNLHLCIARIMLVCNGLVS